VEEGRLAGAVAVEACDTVLRARGLVKRFRKGPTIGPVDLEIRRGEVFALIGPNGAGKTTIIRMVTGIYKPDAGHVELCEGEGRKVPVAYVPEESAIYPRLTGYEHLAFYARLYTGDRRRAEEIAERAARISGLGEALQRRAGEYSKGMKRRLLVSLALALETPLIVLDEPTSGLDVHSAVRLRRQVKKAAEQGAAVLLTTHNMFEVERLADRVAFLSKGRIVDSGAPSDLLSKYKARDLEEAFVKATGGLGNEA
jgi:ABC-2 type transport system ATP-binding protein